MKTLKKIFIYITGHTYSNMSRLFIRLFVGIMFIQFGLRALIGELSPEQAAHFQSADQSLMMAMSTIEIVCALFIMAGFLTRGAALVAIGYVIFAISRMLGGLSVVDFDDASQASLLLLPMMFIGVFFYIILAGPGKVSLDYLISLRLVNRDRDDEGEAEIDKA